MTEQDRQRALEWFNKSLESPYPPSPNKDEYDNCVRCIRESLSPAPVDAVLPCTVNVGAGRFHKGVKVSTLQGAIDRALERREAAPVDEDVRDGDYVIATKFSDGDPGDAWAVGYYAGKDRDRHFVKDGDGKQCRIGGYRRVQKISIDQGNWLMKNAKILEQTSPSPDIFNLWMIINAAQPTPATVTVVELEQGWMNDDQRRTLSEYIAQVYPASVRIVPDAEGS